MTAKAPLVVCCFKWSTPGYRSTFAGWHVDTLRRMVKRHYPHPHRFVCFTDDPRGIDEPDIEIFRLWNDLASVPNPSGSRNPSCYRRLRMFARDVGEWLGPRFVCLDLDCVITGDLSPLWNRPDEFIIWGDTNRANPYNGSMWMLDAGARPQVWECFDPVESPKLSQARGYFGSDQAWFAAVLGPHERRWTQADGVYSFRNEILPKGGRLPADARIVFLHGRHDPWDAQTVRMAPWVEQHYR